MIIRDMEEIMDGIRANATMAIQGYSCTLTASFPADGTWVSRPSVITGTLELQNTGSKVWDASAGLESLVGPSHKPFIPFGKEVMPGGSIVGMVQVPVDIKHTGRNVFSHFYLALAQGGLRFGDVSWVALNVLNPVVTALVLPRQLPTVFELPPATEANRVVELDPSLSMTEQGFKFSVMAMDPLQGSTIRLSAAQRVSITLRNDGTAIWPAHAGLQAKYGFAGDRFVSFNREVAPGESATVEVTFQLPESWEWTYVDTHYFWTFMKDGGFFGQPIRVQFVVANPSTKATDALSPFQ